MLKIARHGGGRVMVGRVFPPRQLTEADQKFLWVSKYYVNKCKSICLTPTRQTKPYFRFFLFVFFQLQI